MLNLQEFLMLFVPLFVAMNVLGIFPLFLSMTEFVERKARLRLVKQAAVTAFVVGFSFMLIGKSLFSFLGITTNDFRIGGGILMLVIGISDLLFSQSKTRRRPNTDIGIVPLGIPLIVGPAALSTLLVQVDRFGYLLTLAALFLNISIVVLVFSNTTLVLRILGVGGARVMSKLSSLILIAIAVMMIRVGIFNIIQS